jgi:hypothetical protein
MTDPERRLSNAEKALRQKTRFIEDLEADLVAERQRYAELESLHVRLLVRLLELAARSLPGPAGGAHE